MPNKSAQRRTQFSSCDACRRSRVACDASKNGHQPGRLRWTGSCSRCSRRGWSCTFEWIKSVKKKPSIPRQETTCRSPVTEAGPLSCESRDHTEFVTESEPSSRINQNYGPDITQCFHYGIGVDAHNQSESGSSVPLGNSDYFPPESNSTEALRPQVEFTDVLLTQQSDKIFRYGFETVFSLMLGRNGCPFIDNPNSEICIPATNLFRKLDASMGDEMDRQNSINASEVRERKQERDRQIDQALSRAIQSFAARWLPLVSQANHLETNLIEKFMTDSWRKARKDMLKATNRVCYRSVLALFLFAQTPVPVGISEIEELDGISGLVCMQTALLQVQRLRERQRSCQVDESEILAHASTLSGPDHNSSLTQAHVDFESRAYWAAVMWDTSSSLTSNFRTSLTSGLNGACSEPVWRLVRAFLTAHSHFKTEVWRTNSSEVSDEVASQISTAAAICKFYVWKNITSLKEAFREGVDEESVLFVWKALRDAIEIFETSIRPLLRNLERRIHFMDQLNRLGWYEVNLQYYLGILVLVDAIEIANRFDLLSQMTGVKEDAEHESINILIFGTENTYTIPGEESNTAEFSRGPITTSFVGIDPYPNHVIDFVALMNKFISRRYRQGRIKHGAYSYLSSILLKALRQLPQSSKIVQMAQENLQQSLQEIDGLTPNPSNPFQNR